MNSGVWRDIGRLTSVFLICYSMFSLQTAFASEKSSSNNTTESRRSQLLQPYHFIDRHTDANALSAGVGGYPMPGDPLSPPSSSEEKTESGQKGLLPNSFQDWLKQDSIWGDPWGKRSYLRDHGVTFGGRYFEDTAGNATGGRGRNVRYAHEVALSVDFDTKKLLGYNVGLIHFMMTTRVGAALTSEIPLFNSAQEVFGTGNTLRMARFTWEMKWNRYLTTEMGEINTQQDFEQASIYWGGNIFCEFQNNGICGVPQAVPKNSGFGFYPTAHPGGVAKFYPAGNDHYVVQVGAYSVDPTINRVRNGWKFGLQGATGTFLPVQFGWHQGGKDDYSGPLQTNVKVGGYWDTSEVTDVYSQLGSFGVPSEFLKDVQSSKIRGRYGAWIVADRMLERDENDPRRSTVLFGTFTWGDPRTAVTPYFMTIGLVRKGTFPSRPDDTVNIGIKTAWINRKLTNWARHMQASGANGLYKPSTETAVEFNYGYRPARWLLVRPGIQYYWSPGATHQYKNALLIDLETAISF